MMNHAQSNPAPNETKFAWPGQYRVYEVQLAWEAWCEAAGIDPFAADAMLREGKQGGRAGR